MGFVQVSSSGWSSLVQVGLGWGTQLEWTRYAAFLTGPARVHVFNACGHKKEITKEAREEREELRGVEGQTDGQH